MSFLSRELNGPEYESECWGFDFLAALQMLPAMAIYQAPSLFTLVQRSYVRGL